MSVDRRATIAYHNDGNGGRAVSINLSIFQFVLGMGLQLAAVCTLGWAVATFVGRAQIREWWRSEGAPTVHQMMIDEIIAADARQDREIIDTIDARLDRVRDEIRDNKAIAVTNSAILERIESDVRELRKAQSP